jgi:hypothetical protein
LASDPPPSLQEAPPDDASPLAPFFSLDPVSATDEELQQLTQRYVAGVLARDRLPETHNVFFLHDSGSISRADANRIYEAAAKADRAKPILLILSSQGGDVAAAYFIAKLCREHTNLTFEVAVPRQAKSAATLICCGADRIHMGSLSELGPIDPQFGSLPALALKHSVEHIAQLSTDYPAAQGMLSDYLAKSLRIEALGYYERVAASATQYAERLLGGRIGVQKDNARNADVARRLVYAYKDHGFAIDSREASDIFGPEVVQCNTSVYEAANSLYTGLDFIAWWIGKRFDRDFSFTGGVEGGCWVWKRSKT